MSDTPNIVDVLRRDKWHISGVDAERAAQTIEDLLEALQALVDVSDSEGLICGPRLIANARAAIAKATGL